MGSELAVTPVDKAAHSASADARERADASEASGQRGDSIVRAHSASEDIRAETPVFAGWCCERAFPSEASGQHGDFIVRAHSASEDARERADDTRPK